MAFKDYYKILGMKKHPLVKNIKKKYRKLAVKQHSIRIPRTNRSKKSIKESMR
jgi:DnaJ-class molecular chaperone